MRLEPLDDDIITTKLAATPYQELADYYLDLLGNSKDDSKVIKALATQFAQNKAIPASPTSKRLTATPVTKTSKVVNSRKLQATPMVSASLSSDSPFCSENFSSAMEIVGTFKFPGSETLSALAKGASKAACPSTEDQMNAQFAKIDAELGKMQSQLNGIEVGIIKLGQKLDTYQIYQDKENINQYDVPIDNWLRDYQSALSLPSKNGKQYNSLKELFDSYGSVDKAIKANPGLDNKLAILYDNYLVRQNLQLLGKDILSNTSAAIHNQCDDASSITSGVLLLRNWCNTMSLDIYAKHYLLTERLRYAVNDVNQVFIADHRANKPLGKWVSITESDFSQLKSKNDLNFNPKAIITPTIKTSDPVYTLYANLENNGFKVNEWYSEKTKRYLDVSFIN